ncbi:MAG: hypothetical protein U1F59_09015 [Candidatus Competibacteraceae bacterium]
MANCAQQQAAKRAPSPAAGPAPACVYVRRSPADLGALQPTTTWNSGLAATVAPGLPTRSRSNSSNRCPVDAPGLLRQDGYLVTGIADDSNAFAVPLNVMNGIADWKHLRGFTVVFDPRRSSVTRGAYWLDDIALDLTGRSPYPSGDPSQEDRVGERCGWQRRPPSRTSAPDWPGGRNG